MNLSDVARHKEDSPLELTDPVEKADFMNMRKVQPTQALTEKAPSAADYERGIDNLIRGLVDLLPKPGSNWTLDDRAKWFRLAAGIFDLGYKAGEGKDQEISIAFVAQGRGNEVAAPKNGQST
jgi:hypothetical protein